jgi:integrase
MGLRWSDVDLASGVIHVERAWDAKSRVYVEPKSRAGQRRVPIPAVLRDYLVERKLRSGDPEALVFGRAEGQPFDASAVADRAGRAWGRAGLAPITLHEARHTFASLMIAAGVNAKALATYLGHSSITITLDRCGHLFPGNEEEAAERLDAYLKIASGPQALRTAT